MKMMMSKRTLIPVVAAVALAAACERSVRLETETFAVDHLTSSEVEEILAPYVFYD